MKRAIIIHGSADKEEYYSDEYPSLSNSHWIPWLQKQLIMNGYLAQTPEMPLPLPFKYNFRTWKNEIDRYELGNNSILIGFSLGGGFLVRFLSGNETRAKILILVAPWLDPSRRETTDFFDFEIDPKLQNRVKEIHILFSKNDNTEGVKNSVETIRQTLPKSQLHTFENKGHFTYEDMKSHKFPDLLKIVI